MISTKLISHLMQNHNFAIIQKRSNSEAVLQLGNLVRLVLSAKSTLCPTISVPLMVVPQGFLVFSCRRKHIMQDKEQGKTLAKNKFHSANKRPNIIQKQPSTIH